MISVSVGDLLRQKSQINEIIAVFLNFFFIAEVFASVKFELGTKPFCQINFERHIVYLVEYFSLQTWNLTVLHIVNQHIAHSPMFTKLKPICMLRILFAADYYLHAGR